MENYIVKFKDALKANQIAKKKLLKQLEFEIGLLDRLLKKDPKLLHEFSRYELLSKFKYTIKLFSIKEKVEGKILYVEDIEDSELKIHVQEIRDFMNKFINKLNNEYKNTQNIINAFENDKIKDPINNIGYLFFCFGFTSLNIKEISRILGIAIVFNSRYAQKNKNHNIKDINIITELMAYYNPDGTFKYNEDVSTFEKLMKSLCGSKSNTSNSSEEFEIYNYIFPYFTEISIPLLVEFLKVNNENLRNNKTYELDLESFEESEDFDISSRTREALKELKKYYKNGTIIAIPENLDKFYKTLDESNLDEKEKKYILDLINQELMNRKDNVILKYLSLSDKTIYEKSIKLLDSFTYSSADLYALKQYIEELQTIFSMLEIESDEEDKEYLLNEIPSIIEQLSIICDRYIKEDYISSNRFIFLTNKEGEPYIYEDIESLDSSYKKAILSLIPKIDKSNQSRFKKILDNEQLLYNMYEVLSPRGHVAFVEVDAGIYVIMGANIPRNGYNELKNRLKVNQIVIQKIENAIKNPKTRNQILKENEEHLSLFNGQTTISPKNQLTLKVHN